MISNPYLPSPSAASAWAEGFIKGFAGPEFSSEPPSNIAEVDVAAYTEGEIAGQQSAIEGLVFSDPCISAGEPHSEVGHLISGVELLHGAWEASHLATLAGGLAGITVALIELACTLPVHTLPPEQVLPNLGQPIADLLSSLGVGSLELYCAAGLDATSDDCEFIVSPMYKSLEQARNAAKVMNRRSWVIASWRTDMCGSFQIVESS